MTDSVEYSAPFRTAIDEEPNVEVIDRRWMRETAPAEYAGAKDEHSDYYGCTYREHALRSIFPRAVWWFMRDGGEVERVVEGLGTGEEAFDRDLASFFADVQASAYCRALQNGFDGPKALEEASWALHCVSTAYRDGLDGWIEDLMAN